MGVWSKLTTMLVNRTKHTNACVSRCSKSPHLYYHFMHPHFCIQKPCILYKNGVRPPFCINIPPQWTSYAAKTILYKMYPPAQMMPPKPYYLQTPPAFRRHGARAHAAEVREGSVDNMLWAGSFEWAGISYIIWFGAA